MLELQEIKEDIKELLQRSAVHNELLRTHESRSLALQSSQERLADRMLPIEKHVSLINAVGKVLAAVLIGVSVQYVIRHLLKI